MAGNRHRSDALFYTDNPDLDDALKVLRELTKCQCCGGVGYTYGFEFPPEKMLCLNCVAQPDYLEWVT